MDINSLSLDEEVYKICGQYTKHLNLEADPTENREAFENIQSNNYVNKYSCLKTEESFKHGDDGEEIKVCILSPPMQQQSKDKLPIIFYLHGGGWVVGNSITHDKIICELSHRTNSVIVFPEYSKSPENKYGIALEQCYAAFLKYVSECDNRNWDNGNLIIAGDSAGGNLAIAITLLSSIRNGPKISKCLVYYPVVDNDFNTKSYQQYGTGYFLSKENMMKLWDLYTSNDNERNEITACPLKATIEQLKGFPETCFISAQHDVLFTEGELFVEKLRLAQVPVIHSIFNSIHGFATANSLDNTESTRRAMDLSINFINKSKLSKY